LPQQGEAAFGRAKRKNLLVETAQPNRAVQPAIQIDFDLPIAQPAAVLGLDFQAEIVPNLFPEAPASRCDTIAGPVDAGNDHCAENLTLMAAALPM
jgi:hypothetical protein